MRTGTCADCGQSFDVDKVKGRLPARCRPCHRKFGNERMARWRAANPERSRAIYAKSNAVRLADPEHRRRKREDAIRRTYGIEPADLDRLIAAQGGRCAICRRVPEGRANGRARPDRTAGLHIDHCHTNSQVRGLLCGNCNTMIGLAKEDPGVLLAAVEYLKRS